MEIKNQIIMYGNYGGYVRQNRAYVHIEIDSIFGIVNNQRSATMKEMHIAI